MAVGLRHAQVNRQVYTAGKAYRVIKRDMTTEVGFWQTVNTQLSAKAATVELDSVVSECGKFYRP